MTAHEPLLKPLAAATVLASHILGIWYIQASYASQSWIIPRVRPSVTA